MYDYNPLDVNGLEQIGIAFKTKEEADAFADIIHDELAVRVGEAISEGLTQSQLDEFDLIIEPTEASRWLADARPDYRQITQRVAGEFKAELLRHRMSIDGLHDSYEMQLNSMPIEELKLTQHKHSYDCLKKAGIDTIGELRKVPDLSQINDFTPECVREVEKKLAKFLERKSS